MLLNLKLKVMFMHQMIVCINNPITAYDFLASCGASLGISLTFVILVSAGIIATLVVIIVFLARAYKKVQVKFVKVQTVKAPNPMSTAPTGAVLKSSSNRIYEEVVGGGTDDVVNVENLAYSIKDFHRRCATPCSDQDSGEAEDAYYTTI